jgi:ATP synthase protein I
MADDPTDPGPGSETAFSRQVAAKAALKLRSLRRGQPGIWFGLGMSGLIGWSVAAPTFLGAMVGLWWDRHHPGAHSWTLALLAAGLVVGCLNAWHWITQEDKSMHDDAKGKDE